MLTRARSRILAGVFSSITLAVVALPSAPVQAGGSYVICAPGVNNFVWDGGGDGFSWNDAPNWDVNCTPGLLNQPKDDVVTIPGGASVRIEDGESAYVLALNNLGTLTITPGGVLKTINDSQSKTMLLQGLLFGTGRFTVTGTMTWQATASGAATMSTRRCALESCALPVAAPGTTVVSKGAVMEINGRGVNLSDQRIIENHGTVRLSGEGYVAADYGTKFLNQRLAADPQPTFNIANDRGYYQGFSSTTLGLSAFVNTGRIVKSSGTGTSVIDANFARTDPSSPYTGAVTVSAGRLTVLSPSGSFTNVAMVKQGAAFANGTPGACAVQNYTSACQLIKVDNLVDPQASSVNLTKPGTELRKVVIQELPSAANPGGFGVPVRIETPNAAATTAEPLVLRIFLDASKLGSATPGDVAALAAVQRQATTTSAYVSLPDCAVTGGPTSTQACVARTQSVTETATLSGDAVLIVKTLQNSRYRVGKLASAT